MNPWCVVRVAGERDGTGYLVNRDRVLTSAHLVGDGGEILVRGYLPSGAKTWKAKKIWPEDSSEMDAVVLEILDGPAEPATFTVLADRWLPGEQPFRAVGFVLAFSEARRQVDDLFHLKGTAWPGVDGAPDFQVDVDNRPEEAEDWEGLSGASVFVRGCLTGLVAKASNRFPQSMRVVSLPTLLEDESFKAAVRWEPVESHEQWKRMYREIRRLLGSSPEAAAAIARGLGCTKDYADGDAESLCKQLCTVGSFDGALDALFVVHGQLRGRGARPAAQVVERILSWVLPLLCESEALGVVTGPRGGGAFLSVPIATASMAELTMAWLDGKPFVFDRPESARKPARPQPMIDYLVESGIQPHRGVAEIAHEYLKEAERDPDRAVSAWATEVLREALEVESHPDSQTAVKMVESALGLDAKYERRRYLLLTPDFAANHRAFLNALGRQLPSLRQLELSGDAGRYAEEYDRLLPLFALLYQLPAETDP